MILIEALSQGRSPSRSPEFKNTEQPKNSPFPEQGMNFLPLKQGTLIQRITFF